MFIISQDHVGLIRTLLLGKLDIVGCLLLFDVRLKQSKVNGINSGHVPEEGLLLLSA